MLRRSVGVALLAVVPAVAAAQPLGWSGVADASGNVLFGAARGRVASVGVSVGRLDSVVQVRGDVQFTYADSRDADGRLAVTARASRLAFAADRDPFARLSPFALGGVETSLQQRIAVRSNVGAGAKLTFRRRGDDDVSVSAALLAERTRALDPAPDADPVMSRVRWSLRGRVRRRFSEAIRLTHVTFYQPTVNAPSRYTVDSNTQLALGLGRAVALTATLRERYDSEARRRGARSNHDGQLLFGVRATF